MLELTENTIQKLIRFEITGDEAIQLLDKLERTKPERYALAIDESLARRAELTKIRDTEYEALMAKALDAAFRSTSEAWRQRSSDKSGDVGDD